MIQAPKNMVHPFYRIKKRIVYRFKTRNRKGHGIHSPYLYRFITSVLQGKNPYYCFKQIEILQKKIISENSTFLNSFGKHQQKKEAYVGQILFRIVQDASFNTLLELGTFIGMETQYMAMAKPDARCISVTRSPELAALAQKGFQEQALNHIELHLIKPEQDAASILSELDQLDFVLFNHISDAQEVQDLFKKCLPLNNNGSIFVFMGIHKNSKMDAAWKRISSHSKVQVSIDTYDLGILLFNPELSKKKYVLRTKYTSL